MFRVSFRTSYILGDAWSGATSRSSKHWVQQWKSRARARLVRRVSPRQILLLKHSQVAAVAATFPGFLFTVQDLRPHPDCCIRACTLSSPRKLENCWSSPLVLRWDLWYRYKGDERFIRDLSGVLEVRDQCTTNFRCLGFASKVSIRIPRRICGNLYSYLSSSQPRVGQQHHIPHTLPGDTADTVPEWYSVSLISFYEEFEQFASLLLKLLFLIRKQHHECSHRYNRLTLCNGHRFAPL